MKHPPQPLPEAFVWGGGWETTKVGIGKAWSTILKVRVPGHTEAPASSLQPGGWDEQLPELPVHRGFSVGVQTCLHLLALFLQECFKPRNTGWLWKPHNLTQSTKDSGEMHSCLAARRKVRPEVTGLDFNAGWRMFNTWGIGLQLVTQESHAVLCLGSSLKKISVNSENSHRISHTFHHHAEALEIW